MEQAELNFSSESPINNLKLTSQNGRLYKYLESGKTIHCMSEAKRELKIGYLNSRVSDLAKLGVKIYKRYISRNRYRK